MRRTMVCGLVLAGAIFGQAADSNLQFEVASVRVAAPRSPGEMLGMRGGPGSTDPERINFRSATLQNLLLRAYGLELDQISGPSWLSAASFDITATLPPGTTQEQFAVMLQNLLVERFKMVSHHEMKAFAVYEVTVARGGLKMKASSVVPNRAPAARGPMPADPAALQAQLQQAMSQLRTPAAGFDADGFPALPEGDRPAVHGDNANGRTLINARGQDMTGVVRTLRNGLGAGARVVDKTGLTGRYDFKLQFARPGSRVAEGAFNSDEPAPDVPEAAESQLGLHMQKGSAQFDVLVIDHIEKTPDAN